MTVTINYSPRPSPGYTPRRSATLHNVESVTAAGVNMIRLQMTFTDDEPTHDHVVGVIIKPEQE
jgi:hypothetical protein